DDSEMNTRRMASRRMEEEMVNEEVPPQVEKVEKVPQGGKGVQGVKDAQVHPQGDPIPNVEGGVEVLEMSDREFREALISIARAVTMVKADLSSYQLRDVSQNLYIQWKDNWTEGSGPIEWKEFKEAFLGMYFHRERTEIKVDEFINLKKAELVVEECCTAMLHDEMTLARLMVYAQSIVDSKLKRMGRSLKRSGASDQEKTRFKKKVQSQGESRSAKFKIEKGGGSKDGNPTCANCGKKHYGEFLLGIGSCFGCGKVAHKVRDCPMVAFKGREGKKVTPSVPKDDASTKRRFCALRYRVEKPDEKEGDYDVERDKCHLRKNVVQVARTNVVQEEEIVRPRR
ncbi:hypothetical protein EJD97_023717, partial [Solanum chilense]